ncbi:methyltransferase domain-containing protein [bacterium]|nr:methyltransferase domain-containing protein [bacterium]
MTPRTTLVKRAWEIRHRKGWARLRPDPTIMGFIKKFKTRMGRTVVDLGCGSGRHLIPLIQMGFEVTGIELTDTAIQQAKARLAREGLKADIIQGDFHSVNLNRRRFDCALSVQSLQFGGWPDIKRTFARVAQMIRPGGLFILRVRSIRIIPPTARFIREKHDLPESKRGVTYLRSYDTGCRVKFHHYSKDELTYLARKNGFKIIQCPTERKSLIQMDMSKTVTVQWNTVWKKQMR